MGWRGGGELSHLFHLFFEGGMPPVYLPRPSFASSDASSHIPNTRGTA